MSFRSLGARQGGQRQPVVSNNEREQDNEREREQARNDYVKIFLGNWIVD